MSKLIDKEFEFSKFDYNMNEYFWKKKLPTVTIRQSEKIFNYPKISVVIANYNNEKYLERMMDSLVSQSIGIENVQVLFCDDKSTDNSLEIILPYTRKYPNIEVYELNENTGGAHGPRNVGLQYVRGDYLVILDSDDWYAEKGLEVLAHLLDNSKSDIVFGGVIKHQDGKSELFSPAYVEKNVLDRPISELPYDFFSWMGPQGAMVRYSTVKNNNLHFVDQRVADDVTFFYQILRMSGTVSQTTQLTTYLNRDEDNISLSKSVNETFLVSWLRALSYIKANYNNDGNMNLFISRRLEWLILDFALRWDTSFGLSVSTLEKLADYIDAYLEDLEFDPSSNFSHEPQKIAWTAIKQRNFRDLLKFVSWHSLPSIDKRIKKINNLYYFIPEDQSLPNILIPVILTGKKISISQDKLMIDFSFYSREKILSVDIRSESQPFLRIKAILNKIDINTYRIIVNRTAFLSLEAGVNQIYVILDNGEEHLIQIGDIQKYSTEVSVIKDINGTVCIEKKGVKRFFITREVEGLCVGDIISLSPTFDKDGKEAYLLPDGRISNCDMSVQYEVPSQFFSLSDSELKKKYPLKLGIKIAKSDIPVYKNIFSVARGNETWKVLNNCIFINYNVDFTPDGELLYYIGNGFVKAEEANFADINKEIGVTLQHIYTYPNVFFDKRERKQSLKKGKNVVIVKLVYDRNNVPRYLLDNGNYITEKPEFVGFQRNIKLNKKNFFNKLALKFKLRR